MAFKLKARRPWTVAILLSTIVSTIIMIYVNPYNVSAQSTAGPLDYIVIYHESLEGTALDQLLALKTAQGYSCHVYRIGDGRRKQSIRWIFWSEYYSSKYAPLYVLLVGSAKRDGGVSDSTADASVNNLIPTHYEVDGFGHLTAYDQWYVYTATPYGDIRIPRAIVGRIPARDTVELQHYVDKLMAYDGDTSDDTWKRNILFVAGDKDRGPFPDYPSPGQVRNYIDYNYNSIPGGFTGSIMDYADGDGTLIDAINSGVGLIAGLTTGSHANNFGYIIERPSFDAETDLSNGGQYPVFLALSCNLGQIDVDDGYGGQCLAENLLFGPSCGVIGIIGPAGFSSDYSNAYYLKEALNGIFHKGITRVGDIHASTAAVLREKQLGQIDTYNMTTVLGDPGIQIPSRYYGLDGMTIDANMEMSGPTPYQDKPYFMAAGIENTKAGIIKQDHILGRRSYKIEGDDIYVEAEPIAYWTLYDNLGLVLDENTRFLTYRIKALEGMGGTDLGFGVECIVDGNLLSSYGIVDHNGSSVEPMQRMVPANAIKYYVYDLESVLGRTLEKVLVGYGCMNWKYDGRFAAIFDDIRISATWGFQPEVGTVQIPTNILEGLPAAVSVSAGDPDTLEYGDELSVQWSVTAGYINGTGFDIVYHAPNYPVSGVEITATVSDRGGHEIASSKTFNVIEDVEPTCPHLFVWNGKKYADQGAFLTRSLMDKDKTSVYDAVPFFTKPAVIDGKLRFILREEGNDVTNLQDVSMNLVDIGRKTLKSVGITADGRIMGVSKPIAPIRCHDDRLFDQTNKVLKADGKVFRAYGPGYLVLKYENLPRLQAAKPDGSHDVNGGGPGLPPPDKNMEKIVADAEDPDNPNFVSVIVNTPEGEWKEIERLAPRSRAGLPHLINLLPYVDSRGSLSIQITWTDNFSVDDLSFYAFSDSDIKEVRSTLSMATHNSSELITGLLSADDDRSATLEPGDEVLLEFDYPSEIGEYNFGVMKFNGKYEPFLAPEGWQRHGDSETDVESVVLYQNVPNPFNERTTILYSLRGDERVIIEVFNILGQRVTTLIDEFQSAGRHRISWDGRDQSGRQTASGIYFYRLTAGSFSQSKKMLLMK
jgi:hypothetical protein